MQHSLARPEKHSSSVPRERRSPLQKGQPVCQLSASTAGGLKKNSRVRGCNEGGFSKYKFVPSIPLH
jgi:hypothetical protein